MYPQHDHHLLELHRLRLEEAAAQRQLPGSVDKPAHLQYRFSEVTRSLRRLPQLRIRIRFEMVEPFPEGR